MKIHQTDNLNKNCTEHQYIKCICRYVLQSFHIKEYVYI